MSKLLFGDEDTSLLENTEDVNNTSSPVAEEIPFEATVSETKTTPSVENKEESVSEEEDKPISSSEIIKEILSWVRMIALGVIVGVLLVVFVIQRDNVYGSSMSPNLVDGEVIFTEKISTYFDNYHRGDIVILDGHDMDGYNREEYLVKRIIGLPGETIRISDEHVYIKPADSDDFYLLDEPYLDESVVTTVMSRGIALGYNEMTLGPDEYFCMGDNRVVSNDSRNLGPFTSDRIRGVAVIAVYPFEMFGVL